MGIGLSWSETPEAEASPLWSAIQILNDGSQKRAGPCNSRNSSAVIF